MNRKQSKPTFRLFQHLPNHYLRRWRPPKTHNFPVDSSTPVDAAVLRPTFPPSSAPPPHLHLDSTGRLLQAANTTGVKRCGEGASLLGDSLRLAPSRTLCQNRSPRSDLTVFRRFSHLLLIEARSLSGSCKQRRSLESQVRQALHPSPSVS
jgi:hypothetical protein